MSSSWCVLESHLCVLGQPVLRSGCCHCHYSRGEVCLQGFERSTIACCDWTMITASLWAHQEQGQSDKPASLVQAWPQPDCDSGDSHSHWDAGIRQKSPPSPGVCPSSGGKGGLEQVYSNHWSASCHYGRDEQTRLSPLRVFLLCL